MEWSTRLSDIFANAPTIPTAKEKETYDDETIEYVKKHGKATMKAYM